MAEPGAIPLLIMAAGGARRMRGTDKLLQEVGGQPLLRRQVQMAQGAGGPVYVALPPDAPARVAAIDGLGAEALIIKAASEGLSASLRGAVAMLPRCPAFLVLLGDLVALESEDLQAVIGARSSAPDNLIWRGATAEGAPGHPILFDSALRPAFAALSGDDGGAKITKTNADKTHLVPLPGQRARFDLDTPEAWAAWRAGRLT